MIMYNDIGAGWTFVILGGCCIAFLPLAVLVIRKGKTWREHRADRARIKSATKHDPIPIPSSSSKDKS
jgi:hypothetical protein